MSDDNSQPGSNPVKRRLFIPRNLERHPGAAYEVADDGYRLWIRENPKIAINVEGWELLWEYKHFDIPGMSHAFLDHIFAQAGVTEGQDPQGLGERSE